MDKKTKNDVLEEVLTAVGNKIRAGISVSMGCGKTHIALEHMVRQNNKSKKFLVVAPKVSIFKSWYDDIIKFNLGFLQEQITTSTYRSLCKQSHDYDYIYLDECHSLKSNHNDYLYSYLEQGGKILGLTGTYPDDLHTEKGKMCNFYCPKVYHYGTDAAIQDEILNDYEIIVHELHLNNTFDLVKKGKNGDWKSSEFNDYLYWTKKINMTLSDELSKSFRIQRMTSMKNYLSKITYAYKLFESQTDKTLMFVNTKEQADRHSHSYHSGNPSSKENLRLFSEGSVDKLTAVEQLNQGINVPDLKVGIILHAYANNRQAAQKIGRLLRLNPNDKATIHILCFVDTIDKQWVEHALTEFDSNKITWIPAII